MFMPVPCSELQAKCNKVTVFQLYTGGLAGSSKRCLLTGTVV